MLIVTGLLYKNVRRIWKKQWIYIIQEWKMDKRKVLYSNSKIKAKIEELDIAILECIYLDDDDKAYKKAVKKDKLCLLNQKELYKNY